MTPLLNNIIDVLHLKAYAAPALTINPSLGISNVASGSGHIFNLDLTNGVDTIIRDIVVMGFAIAGLIALALIIFAGFTYLTSGGDQSGVEKSKKTLMNAIIGLVIILFAFFLTGFLLHFFGIQILSFSDVFNQISNQ